MPSEGLSKSERMGWGGLGVGGGVTSVYYTAGRYFWVLLSRVVVLDLYL